MPPSLREGDGQAIGAQGEDNGGDKLLELDQMRQLLPAAGSPGHSQRLMVPPAGTPYPNIAIRISAPLATEPKAGVAVPQATILEKAIPSPEPGLKNSSPSAELRLESISTRAKDPSPGIPEKALTKEDGEGKTRRILTPAANSELGSVREQVQYGSCNKIGVKEWEVVIWRAPTKRTALGREISSSCARAFPPSTKTRNFYPISAPQMIRCPIGGGSRQGSIINRKTPKAAF